MPLEQGGRCSGGQNRRDREVCPAQLLTVQLQGQGAGEEPPAQGRARAEEVMGGAALRSLKEDKTGNYTSNQAIFPGQQDPQTCSQKGKNSSKTAFRYLYFKLLESEFKERTIVQGEAKVV